MIHRNSVLTDVSLLESQRAILTTPVSHPSGSSQAEQLALDIQSQLALQPLDVLSARYPEVAAFLASVDSSAATSAQPFSAWLSDVPDESLLDVGMDRQQIFEHVTRLLQEVEGPAEQPRVQVQSLSLLGGRDKSGQPEPVELTLRVGQVVCIVGPTGSGKSRLLADIECLAQGDTPTGRRILVDGHEPSDEQRFSLDRKLVAQLSQNMNFVVDMSVRDFITMHARCRQAAEPEREAQTVIDCANELTGEKFSADTAVTQLSGGQTRALMIADVALLSAAPVVLIDEIENAGVDRQRALDLLIRGEKIVLISTHDPLLALRGQARIVIRNGGIAEVIETSAYERQQRAHVERVDAMVMELRDKLRRGERIAALAPPPPSMQSTQLTPKQAAADNTNGETRLAANYGEAVHAGSAADPSNPRLELLLSRRSHHKLKEPGPSDAEFELILRAGLRAPDFRSLQPYRFIVARGDGLDRLGAAMARAASAGGQPADAVARAPKMPRRAPLVVTVICSPKPDAYVPVFDQELCAGSAVLMMQLAARALGYTGVWRTGWYAASQELYAELGMAPQERIVGFLYLGTQATADKPLDKEETAVPSELVSYF